ncbi:MAG: site-specific DNA-methyltransferase [Ignavibacteriales bacterium]|nr:site-specific DNA-methyltransferase [Ignavibacterium sp.]MCZ2268093.1 site-specific DNA-methyltransferase [Ignavibacteriales bacterium]
MPTLNWIGKQAVEKHHLEIPYRLLEYDDSLSAGDKESGNLLIQGDNLHALKALLPYYAGKVKCIYIDPPYNTGKEGWKYNDNVNAPEIKAWLNKTVGNEEEDFTRHDKWLCMMYPRLNILYKFLKRDGIIFISIDDNELDSLKFLLDEIFGEKNRLGILVWDLGTGTAAGNFTRSHEYILAYARNKFSLKNFKYIGNDDLISERAVKKISKGNPASRITFPPGIEFEGTTAIFTGEIGRSEKIRIVDGSFIFENGKLKSTVTLEAGWAMRNQILSWLEGKQTYDSKGQLVKKFFFNRNGVLQYEKVRGFVNPKTILKIASTRKGSATVESILGKKAFDFPKPVELIKYLIGLVTEEDSIILDSFSGSGTTGHSVLELNKEDGGNRKFILVELEEDIAKNVTAERIKRVINGYEVKKQNGTVEKVEGLGGGFRYCKLGEPLFDQFGNVREGVTFKQLAYHIFFSETGVPLKENAKLNTPLIGKYKGAAYYLLFNGILGDKSVNGGNVLTSKVLNSLPKHKGDKIIFGMASRLSIARLKQHNIVFKQIPVEIKTS